MDDPKLTSLAAPEGRVSPFGRPGGTDMVDDLAYTAVIRTHHCDDLLRRTVKSLREQTTPPREILFVDSSNDPACTAALRALGDTVVAYPANTPFNFSKAINLGVAAASHSHVLLISSHVVLQHPTLLQNGWRSACQLRAEAVYWIPSLDGRLACRCVNADTFDGYNGLSNACAMLPVARVLQRPFREEVFAAEDQEWAAWYFRTQHGTILQIAHPDLAYLNPNANAQKTINEEIAIAYYAYPRNRRLDRILLRCARGVVAQWRARPRLAHMHWEIAKGLFLANFRRPTRASRYF